MVQRSTSKVIWAKEWWCIEELMRSEEVAITKQSAFLGAWNIINELNIQKS